MSFLVHDILEHAARTWPDNVAVVEAGNDGAKYTYSYVSEEAERVHVFLKNSGVLKGERVGLLSRTSLEYVAWIFGICKAGAVAVPLNNTATAPDLARVADDCGLCGIFFSKEYRDKADAAVKCVSGVKFAVEGLPSGDIMGHHRPSGPGAKDPDDIAMIMYTSGSTGEPLGVMLSNRNIVSNNRSIARYTHINSEDSICCVLGLNYIFGLSLLFSHFIVGGSLVMDNRFQYPNMVLETMETFRVSGFAGVPSHYAILLNMSDIKTRKLPYLRYFLQAGDSMPPRITRELLEYFPDKHLYLMYGQTEASPRLTYLDPKKAITKPGSVGQAIPGVKVRVVDEE
ncbi:MAG: AMP-binding protein, partial [Candidatus Omnitrophica bacterium]|nr:AMP-binding protein [Candidatus Omnitrophota bacterium]